MKGVFINTLVGVGARVSLSAGNRICLIPLKKSLILADPPFFFFVCSIFLPPLNLTSVRIKVLQTWFIVGIESWSVLVYVLGEEGVNVILEDISRLGVDNWWWEIVPDVTHSVWETILADPGLRSLPCLLSFISWPLRPSTLVNVGCQTKNAVAPNILQKAIKCLVSWMRSPLSLL